MFTQGTMRLVRQTCEGLGIVGTLALGLAGLGHGSHARRWRGGRGACAVSHDEAPYDRQQSALVIQKRRDHAVAPAKAW